MELSVYFMPGIGGVGFSDENASETAKVVNAISPDFVRLRTFVLKTDSEMYDMLQRGEFEECSDMMKLAEIRSLIAAITAPDVDIVSDHIVNLIGNMNGPNRLRQGAPARAGRQSAAAAKGRAAPVPAYAQTRHHRGSAAAGDAAAAETGAPAAYM